MIPFIQSYGVMPTPRTGTNHFQMPIVDTVQFGASRPQGKRLGRLELEQAIQEGVIARIALADRSALRNQEQKLALRRLARLGREAERLYVPLNVKRVLSKKQPRLVGLSSFDPEQREGLTLLRNSPDIVNFTESFKRIMRSLMGIEGELYAIAVMRDMGIPISLRDRLTIENEKPTELAQIYREAPSVLRGATTHLHLLGELLGEPSFDRYQLPEDERHRRIRAKWIEQKKDFDVLSRRVGLDEDEQTVLWNLHFADPVLTAKQLEAQSDFKLRKIKMLEKSALYKIEAYEQEQFDSICEKAELTKSERIAIWLREVEGFGPRRSEEKISEVLGLPPGDKQLAEIISRAQLKIRASLAELSDREREMVWLNAGETSEDEIMNRLGYDYADNDSYIEYSKFRRETLAKLKPTTEIFSGPETWIELPFYSFLLLGRLPQTSRF